MELRVYNRNRVISKKEKPALHLVQSQEDVNRC